MFLKFTGLDLVAKPNPVKTIDFDCKEDAFSRIQKDLQDYQIFDNHFL